MGIRYLLPADKLSAVYRNKKLILCAKGTCKAITTNFTFERLFSTGGRLAYELVGWLQVDIGAKQPYPICKSFDFPHYPGFFVYITTANGIRRVPIIYADSQEKPEAALIKPEAELIPSDIGPVILQIPETRVVLRGQTFMIKASSAVSKGGYVKLENDPEHIHLVKAGIQGGELVWEMSAVKFGTTEVVVTVAGSEDPTKPPYYRVIYEIHVLWLPSPDPTKSAAVSTSFLTRVGEGLDEIKKTYSDAELLSADWKPIWSDQPAKDVQEPGILTVTCRAVNPETGESGSISAVSRWNESWDLQKPGPPIIGLKHLVLDGLIDADKAVQALRDAGYDLPFTSMSLSLPEFPVTDQPYYYFELINGEDVKVGARDGKVQV